MTFTWEMNSNPREWNIKITEIACDSPARAPSGCLQYYTAETGTIMSFNFAGNQILRAQDYSACVRQEEGQSTGQQNNRPMLSHLALKQVSASMSSLRRRTPQTTPSTFPELATPLR